MQLLLTSLGLTAMQVAGSQRELDELLQKLNKMTNVDNRGHNLTVLDTPAGYALHSPMVFSPSVLVDFGLLSAFSEWTR